MKLTPEQITKLKQDLQTICIEFNAFRHNTVQYLLREGLNPAGRGLDPFYLYEGGADLTKQFHKDWQLASKIAAAKKSLSVMRYEGCERNGFNLHIDSQRIEEVSRAFQYVPGIEIPNKWTGNKYSTGKLTDTLLLSFACNSNGSIHSAFAASVALTRNEDGQSGDWTFSKTAKTSAFASFTLTHEVSTRPNFQIILGVAAPDYGQRGGDMKKGLKIHMDKVQQDVLVLMHTHNTTATVTA
jgi:hypothetical protein